MDKRPFVKILIVEDEAIVGMELESRLSRLGYKTVGVVNSGVEALKKVEELRPDLIIMDINLNDTIDGIEVAMKVRERFDIPIIYLTAYADASSIERAKLTQPFGYILKPFQERELYTVIEIALYKHGMEMRLRESETKFRTLFDLAMDAILLIEDSYCVDCNRRSMEMLGCKKEDIVGHTMIEFSPPFQLNGEDSEKTLSQYMRLVMDGRPQFFEWKLKRKDGPLIDAEISLSRVDIEKATYIQAFIRDITVRKEIEEMLLLNQFVVEHASEIILRVRPDGDITYANEAALNYLGYTFEELSSLNIGNIDPCLRNSDGDEILKAIKERTSRNFESTFRTKDGREFPVEITASYIRFLEQDYLIYFARDITERKQTEEALARRKEWLAVTLQSIGDGVIATDKDGRVILVNKVAERLTGWSLKDASGRRLDEVFYIVDEKYRAPVENLMEEVAKRENAFGFVGDSLLMSREGREFLVSHCTAPMLNSDGDIIGVVVVFRDITGQRRAEEERAKINKLESLGVLAGGIAHDFNNIFAAILGNISLARIYMKNEINKANDKLQDAEKAILRAKGLTQRLLTFSKGGAPIKKTASVPSLLKETASFALTGSSAVCEFDIQENLFAVEIDETLMSQVINNLVINAEQAMSGGGVINIRASNMVIRDTEKETFFLKPGKYIKIEVQDRGIGIPEKYLSRVFDPYFTTKEQGSGLGLTIAYSIIKDHGGHITVDSIEGAGTTFTIYLPASDRRLDEKADASIEQTFSGKGRVLLMDDEDAIIDTTGEILKAMGYEVEFAKNGMDAIELFRRARDMGRPFDIVILDLTIPGGMGGKEVIKRLLEIDPDVKAIVSSGYSNDPVMAEYRNYGFSGVVVKPYEIKELSETIRRAMRGDL